MKKIFALTLVLTAVSASAALAGTTAYATGAVQINASPLCVVNTSKNVYIDYKVHSTFTGYAVATYHNKGTKSYGSSSGDSKVYEMVGTNQAAPAAPEGTASANFSSWTSL